MAGPTGSLQQLLGSNGAYLEAGTDANTTPHYGISVRADTVIATWTAKTGNNEGVNMLTYFNIAGATLTADDIALILPEGYESVTITLTSGQVWLLRE